MSRSRKSVRIRQRKRDNRNGLQRQSPGLRARKPSRHRAAPQRRRTVNRITNSSRPVVSVIIPVMNEKATIARVIANARRVHPNAEVIVVANGSKDGSARIARKTGARVIEYPEPLGHDVGRSIGAANAKGDILLFTDGDIVIPAKDLRPLVREVEEGVDVALNQYTGPTHKKGVHNVILAKHVLNALLHRSDLGGVSLTTIPHAMSRRALSVIGVEHLSVPPLALAIACLKGLKVKAVHYIDVGKTNRKRKRTGEMERLILGDHLEALSYALQEWGDRLGHSDLHRKRELVR